MDFDLWLNLLLAFSLGSCLTAIMFFVMWLFGHWNGVSIIPVRRHAAKDYVQSAKPDKKQTCGVKHHHCCCRHAH